MEESKEQVRTCTGDCLRCNVQQRIYCSAQMTRVIFGRMDDIEKRQEEILSRLEGIEQANDGGVGKVFNSIEVGIASKSVGGIGENEEAQIVSGAENRLTEE